MFGGFEIMNLEKLAIIRSALTIAIRENQNKITVDGVEMLVDYAQYLLEYFNGVSSKLGLPVAKRFYSQMTSDEQERSKDGTLPLWVQTAVTEIAKNDFGLATMIQGLLITLCQGLLPFDRKIDGSDDSIFAINTDKVSQIDLNQFPKSVVTIKKSCER